MIEGIPAIELLEGLGELHESVAVCDRSGRVLWTSTALDALAGGRVEAIDKPLASLCQRFVDDVARERQTEPACAHLSEYVDALIDRLESHETVVQFELTNAPAIELSAFGVESRVEAGSPSATSRSLPLYIVVLRERLDRASRGPSPESAMTGGFDMLDRLPEATLVLDGRGFITHANALAATLLDCPAHALIQSPIAAHLPMRAVPQVPAGGAEPGVARRRVDLTTRGEETRSIEVSRRALPREAQQPHAGWVLSLRDASPDQRTIERLQKKVRSLETYVHTVSHDLRSPLVSLMGFTRLLQKEHATGLGEMGQRFLERIEQAGANMNRMTRDLLELSTRAQKGDGAIALVDPREVLLEIEAELKPRLADLEIELRLPSAPPLVQCGRTPLYQLFSNLIGNAVQHMGRIDGARIDVLIAEAPNKRILIVKDNGRGIDAEAQERIFEAFESIPLPDSEPSTGVGLSIVKKIAEAHGGHVEVDSEPGSGAAFTVVLAHD